MLSSAPVARPDDGFGDWGTRQGVESLCGTLGLPLPKAV